MGRVRPDYVDYSEDKPVSVNAVGDSYCIHKMVYELTGQFQDDLCIECRGFGRCDADFYVPIESLSDAKKVILYELDGAPLSDLDRQIANSPHVEDENLQDTVELSLSDTQRMDLSVDDLYNEGVLKNKELETFRRAVEPGFKNRAVLKKRWK